jgi:hypothetical protein
MIDWKHRLFAFLLRRVLGPLLDASAAQKLHDSIDVSLQEGKFILNNISLDASYLTEKLSDECPGLSIRKGTIDRLEINLTLRENHYESDTSASTPTPTQSSLAWRAMKLGTSNESLPAVSLIAEIKIDGVFLEVEPIDLKRRKQEKSRSNQTTAQATENPNDGEPTSKSIIGSYIDAALATLQLNLIMTNVHVKLCKQNERRSREVWVAVKLSSFSYNELDSMTENVQSSSKYKILVNKAIDFSKIIVETGETNKITKEKSFSESSPTTVALAEGSGQIFLRVFDCGLPQTFKRQEQTQKAENNNNSNHSYLQRDIEVRLNHQINLSFDNDSLLHIQEIMLGMTDITEANLESDEVSIFRQSSMMNNPHIENADLDREDLKALTGIMRQYREAYHMAEQNQLRGGILVPSNAYLDEDDVCMEEAEDATFDVFFDANDQSFYNTASILMESTCHSRSDTNDSDHTCHIHTKLRIHLLRACLKINFRCIDQHLHQTIPEPEEYMLATLGDISLSISSSQRINEMALSVNHIQIEDAHLSPAYEGAVEIGRIIGWSEGEVYEEENSLVSQAPCVNIHWNSTRNNEKDDIICNITLLPIEISFRQRTMTNISKFATIAQDKFSELTPLAPSTSSRKASRDPGNSTETVLSFDCPSISVSLPLTEQISASPMFERSGEILNGGIIRENSIGILCENTGFELKSQQINDVKLLGQPCLSGRFFCQNFALFIASPKGEVGFETQMLRKDVFVASGRLEVNPNIPISFDFVKTVTGTKNTNFGRESFPIVPVISSFKARQEDDDDEKVNTDSRKDLRGTDSQLAMLANSEKSSVVLTVNIPEVICELTTKELGALLLMLKGAKHPPPSSKSVSTTQRSFSEMLSIAANLDKVTVTIRDDHQNIFPSERKAQSQIFSFILAMDCIKSHSFFVGTEMKHFRVFSHEFCLYSSLGKLSKTKVDRRQKPVKDRFRALKDGIGAFSDFSVVPIIFRSHLFTPISHETPSILVDFIDLSSLGPGKTNSLRQNRIHLTLYHLTYRYDADSDWTERLLNLFIFNQAKRTPASPRIELEAKEDLSDETEASMTRLFVSCADVNIDYQSPRYFETVSKSIIRIGDFRLSSNLMKPTGFKQAYSLSIGDVTYHITRNMSENSYRNENTRLCRSSLLAKEEKVCVVPAASLFGTMPEAILRELDFVNVLSLDTIDAIAIHINENVESKSKSSKEPPLTINLTLGTLSVHSCKDSFTCFASSVGELQAKLTALTDKDIAELKTIGSDSLPAPDTTRMEEQICDRLKQKMDQRIIPVIQTSALPKNNSLEFLLDGHEWTTVDKDPSAGPVIPPGDEQIAGWYNTSQNTANGGTFPSKIIHQHFPLYITADPLSEGDMGARTFVGKTTDLFLKSRLSIHKLSVKIRFFDGYDWPDKCSIQQKEAASRPGRMFVIEPLPAQILQEKKDKTKDKTSECKSSLAMKSKLMGELLAEDMESKTFFEEVPLPEDRASIINRQKHLRLSGRKPSVFFQISFNGVSLRMDSYEQSKTHRLQSILELAVSKLFIAETVSGSRPIKMFGEWNNDQEHPRDTRFGTLMLSMTTWAPKNKITKENEIESDECDVTVQLMPMRCLLDQRAITFMKAFFNNEDNDDSGKTNDPEKWSSKLHLFPPPRFKTFKIKSWKIKVDYYPTRIDVSALREGSIVELVNLSPIHRMVITLDEVIVVDSLGLGPVFGETVSCWIKEICGTQLHKFLANARPFEPFTDVGQGLTDLVILPYEAFKQGDSIQRAMKKGMKSLAETVIFQTLTTSSSLTKFAADIMADSLGRKGLNDIANPFPSRPLSVPKGIGDARQHAAKSLARGFNAANYKVVIVPYREFMRNGMTGALTSVIKGIPVLLVAPLTGATEAASYTLLGARNALRPDIRKEEEASMSLR